MALDVNHRDPFQGFDIQVKVLNAANASDTNLIAPGFTGFMCRIQVTTEAYLELGQRVPRMLDGEIITTWMLEQGLKSVQPIADTFGKAFAEGYKNGRTGQNKIPRTRRFDIQMNILSTNIKSVEEATFWREEAAKADIHYAIRLFYARIDNGTFGVVAGKRVASSSLQGTAQHVKAEKKDAVAA